MYKYLTLKSNHPVSGLQVLFVKTNITPIDGGEIIRVQQSVERDIWNLQYVSGSLSSPMQISRQISDLLSQISASNSHFEETTETEFINAYNQLTGSFNSKLTG